MAQQGDVVAASGSGQSLAERLELLEKSLHARLSQPSVAQIVDPTKQVAEEALKLATQYALRVAGALLLLILAWFIARRIRGLVARSLTRPNVDQMVARFAASTSGWAVLVLALVACLSIFGVETSSVAAILGAAGVAIGLALQGSLSNLAAGMLLLALRPFRVGDTVIVAGQTGVIDAVELFSTKLNTPDNRRLIVPNSQIFANVIENSTFHPLRRVEVLIGVDYAADIEHTRRAIFRAVESVPERVAEPAPEVALHNLAPGRVEWQVGLWCATAHVPLARQRLLIACKTALEDANIAMPIAVMALANRPPAAIEGNRLQRAEPAPAPKKIEEEL